uniref:Protein recA n=1 Tax=Siphoviridae sp. ctrpg19 TaxID=2826481 RepID=A0A8S5ML60_9CAUD|nr:MAG TPA: Protein recA [Siphoviridae sp. ctrpg19]
MAKEVESISDILKKINKKFGDGVASFGVPKLITYGTLSLGSPSLDFCLYNSLTEGKFVELSGFESSGKTTLAFLIAASFIKKEKERNPENPRKILFVDAEAACDPEWAYIATGYDMNDPVVQTIYIEGSGQTAEEYFDTVIDLVKTGEIGLVIFDSLTMLVSQQIADESLEKKQMGGISSVLGDFCKRAVGLFNRNHCTFIGINGLTENISGYGDPFHTPGGKTWKRACMVRLRVKRGDFFNDDGEVIAKKDAQSPAGNVIEVYVEKTKVCKWDRKLGFSYLNYERGIDLIQDTIQVATYFGLIDDSTQGSYKLVDPETGEILVDEAGKELKIRGKKNVKPYFEEHPELFKSLYKKVYEMMEKKDDPNIVSFEKLLNIDVSEVIGDSSDEE